ncbi:hypothetical protein NLU13_7348 [Sarocladium strictum]|uniref:Uncharacterized protein n=1 Tax=Sarocladium strictum TaxID=5046 RepID=A0AA39GCN3_SARSR|nr:hypothetical protein NLU13_7348 [Sarocladium strictum]
MNLRFVLAVAWSAIPVSGDTYHFATTSLEAIKALTDNLTQAIQDWDGSDLATALSNIHEPAEGLVEYMSNATKTLLGNDKMFSLNQAFRIASPTQRLAYSANASVANLNRRLPEFKRAQVNAIVVNDLKSLLNATQDFSDSLISHVPSDLYPVAVNLRALNVNSLQQGIDCFGGTDSACSAAVVDPDRTYELAVRYDAMKEDGSPIA